MKDIFYNDKLTVIGDIVILLIYKTLLCYFIS